MNIFPHYSHNVEYYIDSKEKTLFVYHKNDKLITINYPNLTFPLIVSIQPKFQHLTFIEFMKIQYPWNKPIPLKSIELNVEFEIFAEKYKSYLVEHLDFTKKIITIADDEIFTLYSDLSCESYKCSDGWSLTQDEINNFFIENNYSIIKEITSKQEISDFIKFNE